ncbi:P-loop NTPase fold protein, partial [Methylophaga muralis]|uniref:P-loop NTPase fold protein n=1 Tax=Methylophaga muralis TaxID=291169 RepID=UPI000AD79CE8
MSDKNSHVKEFINYYCNLDVVPEYALFIAGSWGSGKSHLVQDCIAELKKQKETLNFLYVSLYGITSTEDIETKFFQILNPFLSSKKMVLAGRIAKGVLRGSLKIDLDGDGKHDASAEVTVPSIKLAHYMTDTRNYILVFDDLERCTMDLNRVLGYINYFVEKEGYKVILIADEDKLTNPPDDT